MHTLYLPARGSRILEPASGSVAIFVNGVHTHENDLDAGARRKRVVRPAQA